MVDIHCHIIPIVDDGSKSFEETINMAKKAESLGYTKIVATPHYIQNDTQITSDIIKDAVQRINQEFEKRDIKVKVYSGNEVFFTNDMYELIEKNIALPIENTRYVLMEFPMYNVKPINMENEVRNLIVSGYIPIIAHPERYEFVTENYKDLIPLIELGALMQINLGSISGTYGKQAKNNVKKLLKKNMVHLIGTDSHNSKRIYDIFESCMNDIKKIIKEEKLNTIIKNSDKVLQDKDVIKFDIKKGLFK